MKTISYDAIIAFICLYAYLISMFNENCSGRILTSKRRPTELGSPL
ncbi:unnamed protein product [Brassica napus]|uniref:Uncharacterized protein n=2 Tax=Brassica TaxID=3705 RepID=A0A3P6EA49_BRAOL|nr:unnamed protein product [Brassica napus]VDD36518.1 unnamed protein product [Brassica oleracea]